MKKTKSNSPAHTSGSASRRHFLRGCAAMTATPVLSSILQLKMMNAAYAASAPGVLAAPNEYRALVCVFLLGGNDSFNMLAPREPTEHQAYARVRSDLALPRESLLAIADKNNRAFGLHPAMASLESLYQSNKLAFLSNIGTLIRPTVIADYRNGTALPRGLFSHNDQQKAWQTSLPQSQAAVGWGGRMADIVNDQVNTNGLVSMNVALNSVNIFQTGENIFPYTISSNGATRLGNYGGNGAFGRMFTQATDGVLGSTYQNVLKQSFAQSRRDAIDSAMEFQDATLDIPLATPFPESPLGGQLKMVAQTIAARGALGNNRQTFFVSAGGYDNHNELLVNQQGLLAGLSEALSAFYSATEELGVADQVTSFTASDFGRTLTSNGRGSDHAWGGNQMVMGGAVNGGHVYGDYPTDLSAPVDIDGNSLDLGRGRLLPTTSADQFHAELARWFGIGNNTDLATILPNIRNFYAQGEQQLPIGFMNADSIV